VTYDELDPTVDAAGNQGISGRRRQKLDRLEAVATKDAIAGEDHGAIAAFTSEVGGTETV